MSEIEKLQQQIDALRQIVTKNSKAIVETGSQLLAVQVDAQKQSLGNLNIGEAKQQAPASGSAEQPAVVNEEDLAELVNELQGQLDLLDEKSIRRTANAFVASDDDAIAPLPNTEGAYPDPKAFPSNLKSYRDMDTKTLKSWLQFYELLPPDAAELEEIFGQSKEDLEKLTGTTLPQDLSNEEIDEKFDTLSRFLGLRCRRSPGVW